MGDSLHASPVLGSWVVDSKHCSDDHDDGTATLNRPSPLVLAPAVSLTSCFMKDTTKTRSFFRGFLDRCRRSRPLRHDPPMGAAARGGAAGPIGARGTTEGTDSVRCVVGRRGTGARKERPVECLGEEEFLCV